MSTDKQIPQQILAEIKLGIPFNDSDNNIKIEWVNPDDKAYCLILNDNDKISDSKDLEIISNYLNS